MYTYIKSRYWLHWSISFVLMLAVALLMTQSDYFSVPDLMRIEFASDTGTLFGLIQPYETGDYNPLYNNTLLDFGYMLAYTLLFYFSGLVLWDLLEFRQRRWLAGLLLPLLFDLVENVLLLQMIGRPPEQYCCFELFAIAVRLKWAFAIPGAILTIIVLMYQMYVAADKLYCYFIKDR